MRGRLCHSVGTFAQLEEPSWRLDCADGRLLSPRLCSSARLPAQRSKASQLPPACLPKPNLTAFAAGAHHPAQQRGSAALLEHATCCGLQPTPRSAIASPPLCRCTPSCPMTKGRSCCCWATGALSRRAWCAVLPAVLCRAVPCCAMLCFVAWPPHRADRPGALCCAVLCRAGLDRSRSGCSLRAGGAWLHAAFLQAEQLALPCRRCHF